MYRTLIIFCITIAIFDSTPGTLECHRSYACGLLNGFGAQFSMSCIGGAIMFNYLIVELCSEHDKCHDDE